MEERTLESKERGRYTIAVPYAIVMVAYWLALASQWLSTYSTAALNDAIWTLASGCAAVVCFRTAAELKGRGRLAWRIIAIGCLLWFFGQCAWNYFELVIGQVPRFPHWIQGPYLAYPIGLVAGLIALPKPPGSTGLTVRHAGNLGLIVCAFAAILAIAIVEPAAQSSRTTASISFTLLHVLPYVAACATALYLLWSYPWSIAHWPLAMIAAGTATHAATFIADVHRRFAGTYQGSDWNNVAWLVSFATVACAAHEYAWRSRHRRLTSEAALLARERALEAIMPAILILAIGGIAMLNVEWITTRVIYMCAGVAFVFAGVLGMREAWIQREEQRLVAELNMSNLNLSAANEELRAIERKHRALNVELEERVTERTQKLTRAYEELEHFSYAVAHDLKSPLRAVDGFGALLQEEYGARLDERGHEYLARMRRGALTMSALIDGLLAYARIDRRDTHLAPTNLRQLIATLVEEQRLDIERAGVALEVVADDAELTFDREGLTIALRNVLQNAIKFTAGAEGAAISIRATRHDDRIVITVSDNGIGFDMTYHERIFAMFERLHRAGEYPGTGIGLALSRKAVERAGGRIWAESTPKAGATFHIEIPSAL